MNILMLFGICRHLRRYSIERYADIASLSVPVSAVHFSLTSAGYDNSAIRMAREIKPKSECNGPV